MGRDCLRSLNAVIIDGGNINLEGKGSVSDDESVGIKVEGEDAIGCNIEYGPIFRYTFHLNDNYFSRKAFCYGNAKLSHFHSGSKHKLTGGDKFPVVLECEVFEISFD